MQTQYSRSAKRRGVKKFLLAQGVKYSEMEDYLVKFLSHYGHTNLENKTLDQLMDKSALFFVSLKRYTFKNFAKLT